MTGMEKGKARHNKDRAEAFEKYKNFSKRLSKMMKEESIKMQSKLDKMKEFASMPVELGCFVISIFKTIYDLANPIVAE